MTTQNSVQLTRIEGEIACVTLDMPGSGANILSDQMLTELQDCLDAVGQMAGLKGLILISAKPKIFVAGANLKEINAALDWSDEQIIVFSHRGQKIYHAFGQFEFPSVAAIHGACVGGGLELALGCNHRVSTTDRRSILGLPETNLGLIPGWAGTVRVPRIVGLKKGLELITRGKTFPAATALELGIVDQVVDDPQELMAAAIQIIESNQEADQSASPGHDPISLDKNEIAKIADQVPTQGFAQQVVKQHILTSCTMKFEDACDSEARAFAETWGSEQSHGLLNNFFLGEHNKKNPGFVEPTGNAKPINQVGIVGAGLMGRSIAASCLRAGNQVKIIDLDPNISSQVATQLAGDGKVIQAVQAYTELKDCDLVIETVSESIDTKRDTLAEISSVCNLETIIASNTSSIPISELAESIGSPNRFCGIHFCHPELMKVVEVIQGQSTSSATIDAAVAWVRSLRSMPVAVKDGPGFVVNRLLSAMLDQAVHQLTQGTPLETIDQAVRDFGFAAGPFEIMDIIGIDTCMSAGQIMGQRGIQCVNDSPIVPRMVKRKRLGRKSLSGFYQYSDASSAPQPCDETKSILRDYIQEAALDESGRPNLNGESEIAVPILASMFLEATRILEEGLVASPKDIDICLNHGLAFPTEKGGLLFWAGRFGIDRIVDVLEWLATTEPRFTPTTHLKNLATSGNSPYDGC